MAQKQFSINCDEPTKALQLHVMRSSTDLKGVKSRRAEAFGLAVSCYHILEPSVLVEKYNK
jgi:hypothetical protein